MKTTKSTLATVIGLVRESRRMRAEAFRLKSNPVGRRDRNRLADDLYVKAMWVMGRVDDAAYADYLAKCN